MTNKENLNFVKCPITGLSYLKSSFPKECSNCHHVYKNHEEFVSETTTLKRGGFSKGYQENFLEYRNCKCGSTMVCVIQNRRDITQKGISVRENFDHMLKDLVENGFAGQQFSNFYH